MTSPKPKRWKVSGLGLEPGLSGFSMHGPLCLAIAPLEQGSQRIFEGPPVMLGLARLLSPGLAWLAVAFPLFLLPVLIK